MKRLLGFLLVVAFLFGPIFIWAQEKPHGELKERKKGVHSGNQIRTTFYNTGFIGRKSGAPNDYGVEFPINSGHTYVGDADLYVGSEVLVHGAVKHIVVTPDGPEAGARTGQRGPGGEWFTWMPLPGYSNPDSNSVAMSQLKWSWPAFWPDKMAAATDPGWPGSWNGYFGKNIFNADQESYYVMDDYNDKEFAFYPDSTDSSRGGLGMKVTSRGLQWSNALVQDAIFWLYDIKNIGTSSYAKMVFGVMVGNMMGHSEKGGDDYTDDNAAYDLNTDMAYSWDFDNTGDTGWTPVAWLGYAFLESPGNPYDGIDNDNDGQNGPGPTITTDMFKPVTLNAGDQIVVIDYNTYKRTVTTMPSDSLVILFNGSKKVIKPGQILKEIPNNNFDDNLNGIIDESDGSQIEIAPGVYRNVYLYVGLKYKNYITGEGLDNPMIDERRDDGIDNNHNWDILTDDVGLDGVPNTHDFGEGDGRPTSGWQPGPNGKLYDTGEPGEPHIDKTDINESDMIGLTSFYNFQPFSFVPLSDDRKIWKYSTPGYLNAALQDADADFMFASGYFPSKPQQIERFSMAMVFGWDHDELLRNVKWVKEAYVNNYNFAKAPYLPSLTAVPGDNKVTLYWDDKAELSKDPISGYDFEGYRIYRSSDPGFNDPTPITNGYGSKTYIKPMAQFDLVDQYKGFSPVPVNGVEFFLGKNTGLQHSFVDTTAKNGFTYYYAVTAYDHGDSEHGIPPTETSRAIAIGASGLVVSIGTNVAVVRPEAPVAGYVGPNPDETGLKKNEGNEGTGHVYVKIIDPMKVKNDNTYKITFLKNAPKSIIPEATRYAVINVTDPANPDTLLDVPFMVVSSDGDTLVDRSLDKEGRDFFDGIQLLVRNDWKVKKIAQYSGWYPQPDTAYMISFAPFDFSGIKPRGIDYPRDYELIFNDDLTGRSEALTVYQNGVPITIPSQQTNFTVLDPATGDTLHYAFIDNPMRPSFIKAGYFSNLDNIVFFEQKPDTSFITWSLSITGNDSSAHHPGTGDTLRILTTKPFKAGDAFLYTSKGAKVNYQAAVRDSSLNRVRVVPNPYVVGATWEPPNPYSNGRGPRELHFTHLPPQATIRIYTVRGDLVATIEHNSSIYDGTAVWNMLTKDNLDISYGIYIYYLEAHDASGKKIGEKIGRFAVIK
ncbi:hypothetical protein BMS3Abin05_00088 [bacterium BMS3Abin05]|nr:hypothetical protein BMS3Abin05_00088 [bacterium BMS3Abin05]